MSKMDKTTAREAKMQKLETHRREKKEKKLAARELRKRIREEDQKEENRRLRKENALLASRLEKNLRTQIATEVANLMLTSGYAKVRKHANISSLFKNGLLSLRKIVPQKRPATLALYSHLFRLLRGPPARILELGVKGGASLELWKACFPRANIVGADISLPNQELSNHIVLVQADQAEPETIAAIGRKHGPFDIVIDDCSHIGEHMIDSLLALLPHLSSGALYIMEDIRPQRKKGDHPRDDGQISELLSCVVSYSLRHGDEWTGPETPVGKKAETIFAKVSTTILDYQTLVFLNR